MRVFQKTVAAAGTPEQLTTTKLTSCCSIVVFAEKANMAANTGAVYLGLKGMSKTTGANVVLKLATGTSFTLPEIEGTPSDSFWVDADNNGDGVRVVWC